MSDWVVDMNNRMLQAKMMRQPSRQAGLTLIEMMTAILIGSVLLAGMAQVFVASRHSYKLSESLGYQQVSGRLALFAITEDLRRAGYWGGNADVTSFFGGSITPVTPDTGNYDSCPTGSNAWAIMLQQRVFGMNGKSANFSCIPSSGDNAYTQGDVVIARFADPDTVADADLEDNRLYIKTSLFEGRLFQGSDVGANTVTPKGPVNNHALQARGYYIGRTGEVCDGVEIPSLFAVSLKDDGTPRVQDLVSGVEDLQVQFGLDTNGDGVPNQYVNADTIPAAQWNWAGISAANTVISVRVWVLARAECPDPTYTNETVYNYADRVNYKPADHFRRQLYSTTISLRN